MWAGIFRSMDSSVRWMKAEVGTARLEWGCSGFFNVFVKFSIFAELKADLKIRRGRGLPDSQLGLKIVCVSLHGSQKPLKQISVCLCNSAALSFHFESFKAVYAPDFLGTEI